MGKWWLNGISWDLPDLVTVYITMDISTMFDGKTDYELPFSIAMLDYQRVLQLGKLVYHISHLV